VEVSVLLNREIARVLRGSRNSSVEDAEGSPRHRHVFALHGLGKINNPLAPGSGAAAQIGLNRGVWKDVSARIGHLFTISDRAGDHRPHRQDAITLSHCLGGSNNSARNVKTIQSNASWRRLIALSQVRPYLVAARSSHSDF